MTGKLKAARRVGLCGIEKHEDQRIDGVGDRRQSQPGQLVRFSFPDQHGVLRGKTLVTAEASRAPRNGVTMTSALLFKDTSHVFPVFEVGGGMGLSEMGRAGNFVIVADPETFRVLPWAKNTGWVLCDCYFVNGKTVPIATRQLYRDALAKLAKAGFEYLAGLEVEFHLVKIDDPGLATGTLTWPSEPPTVSHTTRGYQCLTERRYDQVAPIMDVLRNHVAAVGLPLRSLEVEYGPSQYEFTFAPEKGMAPADAMVLFRSLKQATRRFGYLVSFMCRPRLPNTWPVAGICTSRYSTTNPRRTRSYRRTKRRHFHRLGATSSAGFWPMLARPRHSRRPRSMALNSSAQGALAKCGALLYRLKVDEYILCPSLR
jgi:glutamine synthetase